MLVVCFTRRLELPILAELVRQIRRSVGATGLENQYIADGVNITDGGYGGIGVYSPVYGSLGTGLNLTFIQEVQVKDGCLRAEVWQWRRRHRPDRHQVWR